MLNRILGERDPSRSQVPIGDQPSLLDTEAIDTIEDHGAFGWTRGVRERCLMLEIRLKTGAIIALGYSWIESLSFDPTDGIAIATPSQRIRLIGRNLNAELRPGIRLFEGLTRHRVPWVQEADHAGIAQASVNATVIERVET